MKTFFLFVAFLIFTSCHNGNTNVSTGNNTIIYDFPVTQIAESEKIDLEIIGINDLMVIDTLLFAFKASGYNDFFEIYSTNNWQYLGKFLSQGSASSLRKRAVRRLRRAIISGLWLKIMTTISTMA